MYGYALGVLCDHLGTFVEVDDVCDVSRHPYKSRLVSSGPPLPIPVDRGDFPEIGYVERVDLAAEMEAIDQAPRRGKRSLMSRLTGGVIGGGMDDDELAEDMRAYRAALAFAEERGLTLLSLRH